MRPISPIPLFRSGLLLLAMALSVWTLGQDRFLINGRLKVEGGTLAGSRMVVYKNGEKHRVVTTDLNRFSLELELNENYLLSFEKDGFVTKKLSFNTQVPAGAMTSGFTPFEFVVSLFKQYDGVNIVVFNQPVGIIRYDTGIGDFDYDTDYTKSIQSALEAAQAEVAMKQKEEVRKEAEEKKRREQEEKAQAKAAARAAREATAEAKAQAKQEAKENKVVPPPPAPGKEPEPLPEPEPVKMAVEPPMPRPHTPRVITSTASLPAPVTGSDGRRVTEPRVGHDPSPIQPAQPRIAMEERVMEEMPEVAVVRHKDVVVQPNEVVTVIRVEKGEHITEYRRVVRKYSGTFYFKDGKSCSQLTYEQEALAEN